MEVCLLVVQQDVTRVRTEATRRGSDDSRFALHDIDPDRTTARVRLLVHGTAVVVVIGEDSGVLRQGDLCVHAGLAFDRPHRTELVVRGTHVAGDRVLVGHDARLVGGYMAEVIVLLVQLMRETSGRRSRRGEGSEPVIEQKAGGCGQR